MGPNNNNESFHNAWILWRINNSNKCQERIVLLTNKSLYRVKYNFQDRKIIHYKRLLLKDIKSIQKGFLDVTQRQYALALFTSSSDDSKNQQVYVTNSALNIEESRILLEDVINNIFEALMDSSVTIEEVSNIKKYK